MDLARNAELRDLALHHYGLALLPFEATPTNCGWADCLVYFVFSAGPAQGHVSEFGAWSLCEEAEGARASGRPKLPSAGCLVADRRSSPAWFFAGPVACLVERVALASGAPRGLAWRRCRGASCSLPTRSWRGCATRWARMTRPRRGRFFDCFVPVLRGTPALVMPVTGTSLPRPDLARGTGRRVHVPLAAGREDADERSIREPPVYLRRRPARRDPWERPPLAVDSEALSLSVSLSLSFPSAGPAVPPRFVAQRLCAEPVPDAGADADVTRAGARQLLGAQPQT